MNLDIRDVALDWLRALYAAIVLAVGIWRALVIFRFVRAQAENLGIDTTLGAFLSRTERYAIVIVVLHRRLNQRALDRFHIRSDGGPVKRGATMK